MSGNRRPDDPGRFELSRKAVFPDFSTKKQNTTKNGQNPLRSPPLLRAGQSLPDARQRQFGAGGTTIGGEFRRSIARAARLRFNPPRPEGYKGYIKFYKGYIIFYKVIFNPYKAYIIFYNGIFKRSDVYITRSGGYITRSNVYITRSKGYVNRSNAYII